MAYFKTCSNLFSSITACADRETRKIKNSRKRLHFAFWNHSNQNNLLCADQNLYCRDNSVTMCCEIVKARKIKIRRAANQPGSSHQNTRYDAQISPGDHWDHRSKEDYKTDGSNLLQHDVLTLTDGICTANDKVLYRLK